MEAKERREQIIEVLKKQDRPISAQSLARQFSVSRQIVVGDIALLRAAGHPIAATPRGYVLGEETLGHVYQIACRHSVEQTEEEMQICVDQGCTMVDVIVEHPIYGQLTGLINVHSRYEAAQFVQRLKENKGHALSELTDGIHLHTLQCPDGAAYQRVRRALRERGILLEE